MRVGHMRLTEQCTVSPERFVSCTLTVLVGSNDAATPPQLTAGWPAGTSASAEVYTFPSDHFCIDEHEEAVWRLIGAHVRDESPNQVGAA